MTKIAATVAAGTAPEMERQARALLKKDADLVELRLDALHNPSAADLRRLAQAVGPHAIATLRSKAQGGLGGPEGKARHAFLEEACRLGFRYVDVELDADAEHAEAYGRLASKHHQDIIVSHHFDRPVEVPDAADALEACIGLGDVGKVALPVADVDHATAFVELARNQGLQSKRYVLIGTGTAGMLTRALAEDVKQEIQYAIGNRQVAPGQLTLETAARLRGKTPFVLGLTGHPVEHSISPAIQEAALAAAGLPGVYLPFDVEISSLETLLHSADRLRLRGFNVTLPHKEAVADLMDELDGDAEALGAVNTVILENGWAKGHNTDVFGFRLSLRSLGLRLGERKALVLGAGGAARAVVHVLLREGAEVQVANRTESRAEDLADAFDDEVEVASPDDLETEGPWDLLVNATPVGTSGQGGLIVPEAVLRRTKFAYDLVYTPEETPLLQAARRLGIRGTSGLEMLLQQAAKSFELWTGKDAPMGAMRAAAREALG